MGLRHYLRHFHRGVLGNFERYAEICRGASIPIPETYATGLENMWHYVAAVMRPDGHSPLNNDSDLGNSRPGVLSAAEMYNRPDWTETCDSETGTRSHPARTT